MEYPRDIIEKHGWPVVTTQTYGNGLNRLVQPDADRWFLCIVFSTANQILHPVTGQSVVSAPFVPNIGTTYFKLHQLTDGLLVNMGWETDPAFFAQVITIVQCFARKPKLMIDPSIPQKPINSRRRVTPTLAAKLFMSQRSIITG